MLRVSKRDPRLGYINVGSGEWDQSFWIYYAVDKTGIVYQSISLYDQYSVGEEVELSVCWIKLPPKVKEKMEEMGIL